MKLSRIASILASLGVICSASLAYAACSGGAPANALNITGGKSYVCDGTNWVENGSGGGGGGGGGGANCAATTVSWGAGCSASAVNTAHGLSMNMTDSHTGDSCSSTYDYSGTATATCQNGSFVTSNASCSYTRYGGWAASSCGCGGSCGR